MPCDRSAAWTCVVSFAQNALAHPQLVVRRYTLSVRHDERDLSLDALDDRVGGRGGRYEDGRNARVEHVHALYCQLEGMRPAHLLDAAVRWLAEECLATLVGSNGADNVGAPVLGDGAVRL